MAFHAHVSQHEALTLPPHSRAAFPFSRTFLPEVEAVPCTKLQIYGRTGANATHSSGEQPSSGSGAASLRSSAKTVQSRRLARSIRFRARGASWLQRPPIRTQRVGNGVHGATLGRFPVFSGALRGRARCQAERRRWGEAGHHVSGRTR